MKASSRPLQGQEDILSTQTLERSLEWRRCVIEQEKSCGAVVYRKAASAVEVLLLCHKNGGHWAFPKGHVEDGETEKQTAEREILEETGLTAEIDMSFRKTVNYSPKSGVMKEVVYFAATVKNGKLQRQEAEVLDLKWFDIDDALKTVSYENDRQILNAFKAYLAA